MHWIQKTETLENCRAPRWKKLATNDWGLEAMCTCLLSAGKLWWEQENFYFVHQLNFGGYLLMSSRKCYQCLAHMPKPLSVQTSPSWPPIARTLTFLFCFSFFTDTWCCKFLSLVIMQCKSSWFLIFPTAGEGFEVFRVIFYSSTYFLTFMILLYCLFSYIISCL